MSEQELSKIADDIFEAFNNRDADWYVALCAEDAEYQDMANPSSPPFVGREEFKRSLQGWWAAFPDVKIKAVKKTIGKDRIDIEAEVEATHKGELMGIPATGKRVNYPTMEVLEIKNGLVQKIRAYYNVATIMEQLGIVPEKVTGEPPKK